MFRKNKDGEGTAGDGNERPPMKPFSARGTHGSAKPPSKPPAISTAAAKRAPEFQGAPHRLDRAPQGDSKTLVIGRDISLSGDIGECERLIVEGQVEVTLGGARLLEVLPSGLFKGACETVNAEISGRFEGELTVSDTLTVRSGGRVSGTVRYRSIVIESGGEVSGDLKALAVAPDTP